MGGLDHRPNHPAEQEDEAVIERNTRNGLILFVVYLALYVGFVALAAFGRDALAAETAVGVNLAIVYGFGLIGGALALALIYAWLCRSRPPEIREADQ